MTHHSYQGHCLINRWWRCGKDGGANVCFCFSVLWGKLQRWRADIEVLGGKRDERA